MKKEKRTNFTIEDYDGNTICFFELLTNKEIDIRNDIIENRDIIIADEDEVNGYKMVRLQLTKRKARI